MSVEASAKTEARGKGRKPAGAGEGTPGATGGGIQPPDDVTAADASPGVPGFHSWRAVYVLVFTVFVITVIALAIFSSVYA